MNEMPISISRLDHVCIEHRELTHCVIFPLTGVQESDDRANAARRNIIMGVDFRSNGRL